MLRIVVSGFDFQSQVTVLRRCRSWVRERKHYVKLSEEMGVCGANCARYGRLGKVVVCLDTVDHLIIAFSSSL